MENISRRTFLALTAGAVADRPSWAALTEVAEVPSLLDHVLLGCNNLEHGIAVVEERIGVRAAFGGVHPGRGTQNALLSLGERRYLEIIAPDPKQASVQQFPIIAKLEEPQVIGWAAHPGDLETFAQRLSTANIAFEGPTPGSRQRPDGKLLKWKALRLKDDRGGLFPFFIEWSADSVHPSMDAPSGCRLTNFGAFTPQVEELTNLARLLDVDIRIQTAKAPRLDALFAGPKGGWSVSS